MSEPVPLGKLIEGEAERDAVHVAIVPMTATCELEAGAHVNANGEPFPPYVGIVDPFLKEWVDVGERFYVCLYPNSVTGMRHHWQHPAFSGQDRLPTQEQVAAVIDRAASQKWMDEFASQHWSSDDPVYDGFGGKYTSEMLIDLAKTFLLTGDHHVQQGSETLRDNTPVVEFWKHFEVLTGMKVAEYHVGRNPFCCTC